MISVGLEGGLIIENLMIPLILSNILCTAARFLKFRLSQGILLEKSCILIRSSQRT